MQFNIDEARLWCLWDPRDPRPDHDPAVTEGYMAEMLGVDRLTLRGMYNDFLDRHNAQCAMEVRLLQMAERQPELAESVRAKIEEMYTHESF